MIESIELYFREKKRFKNGVIVQSLGNAKHYAAIRKVLIQFTNDMEGRSHHTISKILQSSFY